MGTDEIRKSGVQRQKRRLLMVAVLSVIITGIIAASHQISKSIVTRNSIAGGVDQTSSSDDNDDDDDTTKNDHRPPPPLPIQGGNNKNIDKRFSSQGSNVAKPTLLPTQKQLETKKTPLGLRRPTGPFGLQGLQLPNKAQIGMDQVSEILDALPQGGNMLVWGLGNDSPFWHNVTGGNVIFLEDDFVEKKDGTQWFDFITRSYPFLDAYKVTYSTHLTKSWNVYHHHPELWEDQLMVKNIPEQIWNKSWDVILVDAPLGCCNMGPGRYQSIYTSLKIVEKQKAKSKKNYNTNVVHIFVDDYERKVERDFSREVYQREPMKVVKRELGASNANEQAHFVF